MKQFKSQLQQKNATVSIGYNRNHEVMSQSHATLDWKLENTTDRLHRKFKGLSRKFDEFLVMFSNKY